MTDYSCCFLAYRLHNFPFRSYVLHHFVRIYNLHFSQYIPVRLSLQPSEQTAVSFLQKSFKQFVGLHPHTQEPFPGWQ